MNALDAGSSSLLALHLARERSWLSCLTGPFYPRPQYDFPFWVRAWRYINADDSSRLPSSLSLSRFALLASSEPVPLATRCRLRRSFISKCSDPPYGRDSASRHLGSAAGPFTGPSPLPTIAGGNTGRSSIRLARGPTFIVCV
jgi:hypothetical protein